MNATIIKFKRHDSKEQGEEFVSGSRSLLRLLRQTFNNTDSDDDDVEFKQQYQDIQDPYKKLAALGLIEAYYSKILILDERLFENYKLDYGIYSGHRPHNSDIHIATLERKATANGKQCISLVWAKDKSEKQIKTLKNLEESIGNEYDFILCHAAIITKLRQWENTEYKIIIDSLTQCCRDNGKIIVHTGSGNPLKIKRSIDRNNIKYLDFVNLRHALFNGKFFLVQLLKTL